jgi:hypothetical protein
VKYDYLNALSGLESWEGCIGKQFWRQFMKNMMRWVLPLLLIFLIAGSGTGFAQSVNAGDIRGSVTDSTGALIPGVTVTVLNVDTGVSKDFTTNQSGLYDTNSIVPGQYTITFMRDGFDSLVRGPITLEVGFTTVNGVLKVGSTKEQVTVTTDVPLLTTETGDQSTTLDAKSMDELPQVTQDWENFVILLPGAAGTTSSSPGQEAAINGNLPYSNILSDGASTTLGQSMNANPTTFEDVAELQINTSSFSAQYGIGGVIFNQITKSGTSSYHGTAYDFIQNTLLNAYSYSFGAKGIPSPLHYNNFGGALGGPMPKLKKAFFYFNYDHIAHSGAGGSVNRYTVPTPDMMIGNFSAISAQLYDPTTQTIATDSNGNPYPVRQAFQNNTIPSGELDSVAAKFIQWYPTPTNHIAGGTFLCGVAGLPACSPGGHGEPTNNFASALSSPMPVTRYFGRLDYDLTPKNRLTMSEVENDAPQVSNPSGVEACPVGCQSQDIENNNAQVTDVWTINSHMVNEARLGYTYQFNQFQDETAGLGLPAQLGWKFAKEDDFPDIDFEDGDWTPAWINKQGNNLFKEHVFDPSDVVTLVTGKHILHFGGEVLMYRNDSQLWNGGHQAGAFGFGSVNYCGCNNDYTAQWATNSQGAASINNGTGWAMADFLLGYAASWSAQETPEFGSRLKSPQFFVQDDWKIRPTLTVNLGIRYQINHGWNEIHGDLDSFDPTVINPATNTLGAMWFGNTHANGRTSMEANVFNTVLPRVGFSWLKDAKTTIRGGFGVYAYNWSADDYGNGIGAPFGASGNAQDATGGITPIVKLDGPGTNFVTGATLPYISNNTAPDAYNGQGVSYTAYHTPVPRIYQWNLAVQRELAPNLVAEVGYVASHAFDLIFGGGGGVALNQIPESQLLSTGVNTAAIPYPNFSSITGYTNNAISNYNSLQAQITQRFHSGLSFNFNYVWSHMLDSMDSSAWGSHAGPLPYQNAYDPGANYASSNFDVRNAFKGNVVYQLPFGKGKAYLSHNTALDEVVGGWQVSGSMVLSTGNPFSLTGTQLTNANGGGAYPNWSGLSPIPAHKSITTWYNTAAFQMPANGTFGNVGRNVLYGPGIDVVNLSAHKEFALLEAWHHDVKLQFRADASNAFNHPSFGSPNGSLTGATTASPDYTGTAGGQFQINSVTVGGRNVQVAMRLNF